MVSLYWNNEIWYFGEKDLDKPDLPDLSDPQSFVVARKVFVGGIQAKQVSIEQFSRR